MAHTLKQKIMAQKALVIGGSGYVGLELCRQLKERGDQVATLNRSRGSERLPVETVQADITDRDELNYALKDRRFDVIYHVASLPGDTGDQVQMMRVNIMGLTHVLDYARLTGIKRFVLSSSISAYEWYPATKFNVPDHMPVDEEHPCRPKDMYSSSKRMQEILALTFYHQYQVPVVVLRLTAVVGSGGRGGGRGWREFAQQLHDGKSVQIPHFSLDEVCHYIDLRDVARMQIVAAEPPNAVGQIFNCCGPKSIPGHEFAAIVKRHFPDIRVETGFPWSMAQGNKIEFDMSKAKRLLDCQPIYSLEDSILSIKQRIEGGGLEEEATVLDKTFGPGAQVTSR
ncbi:MAG: NAD(P)-dependent oxidoreductase [Chloroflexi bacterium]|nr:NAD(P)-dependent oxidoreductase [Chloroflexota bacterium]